MFAIDYPVFRIYPDHFALSTMLMVRFQSRGNAVLRTWAEQSDIECPVDQLICAQDYHDDSVEGATEY